MGINRAVKIDLVEMTDGVRKANGEPFEYHYFGWREPFVGRPYTKTYTDKNGATHEKQIQVTARNIAIPQRKAATATEARAASKRIGTKIGQTKGQ